MAKTSNYQVKQAKFKCSTREHLEHFSEQFETLFSDFGTLFSDFGTLFWDFSNPRATLEKAFKLQIFLNKPSFLLFLLIIKTHEHSNQEETRHGTQEFMEQTWWTWES